MTICGLMDADQSVTGNTHADKPKRKKIIGMASPLRRRWHILKPSHRFKTSAQAVQTAVADQWE